MTMKRACLILLILVATSTSSAAVSLPFTSSFNTPGQCGEWNQTQGSPTCDGWDKYGDWNPGSPYYEAITTNANNASGGGGRGNRHWVGTGKNNNSGGMRVTFSTRSEVWVRFYKRWGSGFGWNPLQEDKLVWMGETGAANTAIFSLAGTSFRFWNQNQSSPPGNDVISGVANTGWNHIFGGSTSDGSWHCFEFHVKMNSAPGVYDGVEQAWVDGNLALNATNVNLGGGAGWGSANFNINSDYAVPAGGMQSVDLDDIAISATGYIGPIGGGGGGDTTAPTVPTSLSATAISSSQIDLAWTASTDAVGVTGYRVYRGGVQVGTSTINSYSDSGLLASTTYTYTVSAYDAAGNVSAQSSPVSAPTLAGGGGGTILLHESFDSSSFASRGWYDTTATASSISSVEHFSGTGSYECRLLQGTMNCAGGDPRRYIISPSAEELFITYYIKHSSNWVGSGVGWHPHIFYIVGDLDGDYTGFYGTYLTTYVEEFWPVGGTTGFLRTGVQDSLNIPNRMTNGTSPANRLNTETRDVGGCSGQVTGDVVSDTPDCYYSSGYLNLKRYNGSTVFNSGNKNAWHKVDVHLKMNTIVGGIAQPNGISRVWFDNTLVLDKATVVYRTGQHPTEKWRHIALSPYMDGGGSGSPVDQTMWIDDLTVTNLAPSVNLSPNPVTGITIH